MVYIEQGTGDAIQFIHYAPIVKQLCRRLTVLCPEHMYELFKLVEGIDELLLPGEIPLSSFDTYIPLLSIARVLKITPYNTPTPIPHIRPVLRPEMDEFMKQHLGKFNVGCAWVGSPSNKDNHLRSCQVIDLLMGLKKQQTNLATIP